MLFRSCTIEVTIRAGGSWKRSGKKIREKLWLKQTSENDLILGYVNAWSVVNKWDDVMLSIIENNLDILMVTETWIPPKRANDSQLLRLPPGYEIVNLPRSQRKGGGIAIIFRNCFQVQSQEIIPAVCFEALEVVLTVKSYCLRLLALYRPPPNQDNGFTSGQFITEFSDYLESRIASSGKLVIGGDFNYHWNNPQNSETRQMMELLKSFNMLQHISGPTQIAGNTLDWILTRESDQFLKKAEVGSLISDHHLIKCNLNLSKPPLPKEVRTFRSFKSLDIESFEQDISESELLNNPTADLDGLIRQYNNTFESILNKYAPLKTARITIRPIVPWFNDKIYEAQKVRHKHEAVWRKSRLTVHREIYKEARNNVTQLIKEAKTTYYTERIDECGDDQKALFGVLDEVLGRKKVQMLPPEIPPDEIPEKFSAFFHIKIANIRQTLDADEVLPSNTESTVLPVTDPQPSGLLSTFELLTCDKIRKLISQSPTKSCVLDPLPTWLLKKLVDPLLPTITNIINMSLESSVFPHAFKEARVTPLLKKATLNKSVLKNYRPVSNLCFLSKLLERAVIKQLVEHMEQHNLFVPIQSAYRSKHSTETALLKIVNDILMALDTSKGVILVLLDLSAAFDTIDHEILVSRLQTRIGIESQALKWFQSYLEDRYQVVYVNGRSSDPVQLIYGVPQGSVLGPMEFLCYMCPVYDIARQHGISIHQYADDTQLYLPFQWNKQDEAIARMESCLEDIRVWMKQNKLKLNEDKSELLILHPARQAHKVTIDSVQIGDCTVQAAQVAKNLGATFDAAMTMNDHITSLVKSCNFQLRSIGQARKYLSSDATEKIIHALLTSRLDNGNALLYGLPDYQISRLQRLQNTAARILTRTKKYDHISPIIRSLHWLPVARRIDYKVLILTFKCLHDLAPTYLKELIQEYIPPRALRSSSQMLLREPRTRLQSYGDRSFAKAAPVLWNNLPFELRICDDLDTFKSHLKTFLFDMES